MNWIKNIFRKKKQYNFEPLQSVMNEWIRNKK